MKITYKGTLSRVELPGSGEYARGEAFEVPDELGKKLIAQDPDSWTAGAVKAKGKGGEA